MNCKLCGKRMTTTDSRLAPYGVRRRHKCESCGHRFSTVEIPMSEYKFLINFVKTNEGANEKIKKAYDALSSLVEYSSEKEGEQE